MIEGIFKIWISIFGTAGKFLVDNVVSLIMKILEACMRT